MVLERAAAAVRLVMDRTGGGPPPVCRSMTPLVEVLLDARWRFP
ncbi:MULTISPECIES: hypothetical protein [unclassified Streptomyces]